MTRFRCMSALLLSTLATLALSAASSAWQATPPDSERDREPRLSLDLDAKAPYGPAREALAATLRSEIRLIDAAPATPEATAGRALRERAVLLLEARGGESAIAALAGLRLALARDAVDRFAERTMRETEDLASRRVAEWRAMLLARFANRSLEDLRMAVAGRRPLDGPLSRSMMSLLEAMTVGTDHQPGDHWPPADRSEPAAPLAQLPLPPPGPKPIERDLSSESQAALDAWRASAEASDTPVGTVEAVAVALEFITSADRLPESLRQRIIDESTARLRSEPAGGAWVLAAADLLAAVEGASRRPDRSRRGRSQLVESVLKPLLLSDREIDFERLIEAMEQAAAALELASIAAAVADRPIRRQLAATRATLRRRAVEAESRWLSGFASRGFDGDIDRTATRRAAIDHIADLERLEGLSRLVDRIAALAPESTVSASVRARELAAPLVEPLKRSTAATRIDATLSATPLQETALDRGLAILQEEAAIVARLEQRRRVWIDAWIAADDRTAASLAEDVAILRELTRVAEEVAEVGGDAPKVSLGATVAVWGAWWIRPEAIDAAIGGLAPRVGLAISAWLRGDPAAAARILASIGETMPVAALAVAVDEAIGSELEPLAAGALGVIESLALPPGPDAWFPLPRATLAELSLLEFERHAALAEGRSTDAERIRIQIAAALAAAERRRVAPSS